MTFAAILFISAGAFFIISWYATLLIKEIWIGPMGMLVAVAAIALSCWAWFLGPRVGLLLSMIIGAVVTAAIVLIGLKLIADDLEWAERNRL